LGTPFFVVSSQDYLETAKDNNLPVELWVYFQFGIDLNGNYVHTRGMQAFDKYEFECLGSGKDFDELRWKASVMSRFALDSEVEVYDGQTFHVSDEERVEVRLSPGEFVEGTSAKLHYNHL
jgi:hypothetical protein